MRTPGEVPTEQGGEKPTQRLRVLVLSDLFPNPARPALGVFVERQVHHLGPVCEQVVLAPIRMFPHLRLWKRLLRPKRLAEAWRAWRSELDRIPARDDVNGVPVFYPRYTSPPRQVFHALWGFFAYAFVRGRLRSLHRARPFDLIHAHYASPCGVIALLARRWMKVPIALSVHGSDITYTVKQNVVGATIIRWVFRNVDVVLANSTLTMKAIVRHGADPRKVKIVRLGGNMDRATSADAESAGNQRALLLTVGYLEERKGHAYVLRAVRQLLDEGYRIHYTIVGDGPEADRYRKLVDRLRLVDVVSFEGYKPHDAVWPYFAACDLFVLPSWNEAFGVAYVEALHLGKAVIGCEGEGGPEDLRSLGDCVALVKPRDVESLVRTLRGLLDDPGRRRQMGETGRRVVRDHFTWERNAADTFTLYRQLLESRGA